MIPIAFPDLSGNEKKYLNKTIESSWISSKGEFIDKFERNFANFVGSKFAISCSNGTAALHLALKALNITNGDEVIVPNLTFIASVNAITFVGAKPVLVDVDKKNWNIDLKEIARKISKKTRVIMPVHLYGLPANMERIMEIANKYNLHVIEDAAEAHGAKVKIGSSWKMAGTVGEMGCFSFYGNKIITTGEGGMIVTDDKQFAEKMKILRDHGQEPNKRYYHPVIGFNYRMTNMQSAIGVAQMEKIKDFLLFKDKLSSLYRNYLKNVPGIYFPEIQYAAKSVCWLFSLIVDKPFTLTRDELIKKLYKAGIESRPFFQPVSNLPPYKNEENFPNSQFLSLHGINLPSGYNLKQKDVKFICRVIKSQL